MIPSNPHTPAQQDSLLSNSADLVPAGHTLDAYTTLGATPATGPSTQTATQTAMPSATETTSQPGTETTSTNALGAADANELSDVETTAVWGIHFALVNMDDVIQRADEIIAARHCKYFITANLNYLMLTAAHADLRRVNDEADLMIADGNPIVMRSMFNVNRLPERVAGSDMIVELARLSAERGYRIFFLGGAPGVAQKAADRLQEMFPTLQVAGCAAPPFRALSDEEQAALHAEIRESQADILLVAFGQPKGERWIHAHHRELGVPLSIQLGASFDFLAGTARRAPRFWQWIGCEWLYRTLHEPKRLAPRYISNIAFLLKSIANDLYALGR